MPDGCTVHDTMYLYAVGVDWQSRVGLPRDGDLMGWAPDAQFETPGGANQIHEQCRAYVEKALRAGRASAANHLSDFVPGRASADDASVPPPSGHSAAAATPENLRTMHTLSGCGLCSVPKPVIHFLQRLFVHHDFMVEAQSSWHPKAE